MAEVLKVGNRINKLSDEAKGKIEDIKNIDGRLTTLNKNITTTDPVQQYLQSEEYITSTLEGLAGKIINEAVTDKDIQNLLDNLHTNLEQNLKILLPDVTDKLKFDVARAEAVVKGFMLPLNKGGPFDELFYMGIDEKEIFDNPIEATKKALVAVSGQAIPKEQYAQAVKNKAMEILKQNPKNSPEQLEKYEKFITQGDTNQKYANNVFVPKVNKLSQIESNALQEAATSAVQQINNRLKKCKEVGEYLEQNDKFIESLGIKNPKVKSILLPTVSKLSSEELQEKGSKIVKDFAPLFESKNKSLNEKAEIALNNLAAGYLAENSAKIATELKEVNDKGISLWEKFKSVFTGKDYLGKRLEQSINKYAVLSDEYVKKEINDKIFSNALTNEQIVAGLTKFTNKNIDPKEVNNLNLVELRKTNPVAFDETVFEDSKRFAPNSKSGQIKIESPPVTSNLSTKNQIRER